jgi:hypothetical protein
MNNKEYCTDNKFIDHRKMLETGWKTVDTLPSTDSHKSVLLVINKHNKRDSHVVNASWMPYDNYTKGKFVIKNRVIKQSDILYWRGLDFIIET